MIVSENAAKLCGAAGRAIATNTYRKAYLEVRVCEDELVIKI